MLNVEKLLRNCIFYSIVLGSFNGIALIQGFLFSYGFFWPSTVGMLIFILTIKRRKIYINNISKVFFYFILWGIFSTFIQLNNIIGINFKGYSGEKVMLEESFILIWLLLFILYCTKILMEKSNVVFWIYTAIKIGFYVNLIFIIVQALVMLDFQFARDINMLMQTIINKQYLEDYNGYIYRISGTTREASSFGNYIATIFPWLIIGTIYFNKSIFSKALCIIAIVSVIFSYSRIAYFSILIELFIILIMMFNKIVINKKMIFIILGCIFVGSYFIIDNDKILESIMEVFFSFSDEAAIGRMTSNITRFSLQVAAFNIFIDNPFLGIGIGQYGFHYPDFLPSWAFLSREMISVVNPAVGTIKYGAENAYLRILAENGIVGFAIWLYIGWLGLKNYLYVLKYIDKEQKNMIKLIILSYLMSMIGFINFDMYIFFYYWLFVILSCVLVFKIKNNLC